MFSSTSVTPELDLIYAPARDLLRAGETIATILPAIDQIWVGRYEARQPDSSIEHFDQAGASYVFDGGADSSVKYRDRTIAAYGAPRPPPSQRDANYQAGFPLEDRFARKLDRGHMFPHSGGGMFGPNLFPQDRSLNRGWSDDGRRYRAIESRAARLGLFFFCALVYCDDTDMPAFIELVTIEKGKLHVEAFRNRFDEVAVAEFPISLEELLASLTNSQLADLGEETAKYFLEAELDATIIAVGDSRMSRSGGRQDLDIFAILDGEPTAIEVKARYFSNRAGTLTRAGNLYRPQFRKSGATSRQGSQEYAAERLEQFIEVDGEIPTVVAAVDLRAFLIQLFRVDNGRITGPSGEPVDCRGATKVAAEELIGVQISGLQTNRTAPSDAQSHGGACNCATIANARKQTFLMRLVFVDDSKQTSKCEHLRKLIALGAVPFPAENVRRFADSFVAVMSEFGGA
jgi:hypothetical protein